jgi:hypothetical protein
MQQTYRSPRWNDFVGAVLAPVVVLAIGISGAIDPGGPDDPGTAPGYIATGCAICAVGVFLAVSQIRSRLVVNDRGLTWCFMMRRKSVSWADVQGIDVVAGFSLGNVYSPAVTTNAGVTRINSVLGSRPRIERIVTAIGEAPPNQPALCRVRGQTPEHATHPQRCRIDAFLRSGRPR